MVSSAELSDEEVSAKWIEFHADINNDHSLEWEFENLSNSIVFLDLRLTSNADGIIKTTLCKTNMALHFFISPNSMHPPVVLYSHVCSNIL